MQICRKNIVVVEPNVENFVLAAIFIVKLCILMFGLRNFKSSNQALSSFLYHNFIHAHVAIFNWQYIYVYDVIEEFVWDKVDTWLFHSFLISLLFFEILRLGHLSLSKKFNVSKYNIWHFAQVFSIMNSKTHLEINNWRWKLIKCWELSLKNVNFLQVSKASSCPIQRVRHSKTCRK